MLAGNAADPAAAPIRWRLRLAGGAAVAFAAAMSVTAGYPTWWSPHALATVLPILYTDSWLDVNGMPDLLRRAIEPLPLAIVFVLWTSLVVRHRLRIPWPSLGLALLTAGLSALTIVSGWTTALHVWGPAFTFTAAAGNLAAVAVLVVLLFRNRHTPSRGRTFAFHLVLFVWIAWCASPWFAEGL